MKTVLKLVLALVILTGITANAQKRNITLNELPKPAQTFISTHFKGQTVSYAIEDKGILSTDYDVMLSGGTEIEFDSKGKWKELDGNKNPLPASVIPKAIADYVNKNYKGQGIEKIDIEGGYKVELLNDLELKFDTNGRFLRIDD